MYGYDDLINVDATYNHERQLGGRGSDFDQLVGQYIYTRIRGLGAHIEGLGKKSVIAYVNNCSQGQLELTVFPGIRSAPQTILIKARKLSTVTPLGSNPPLELSGIPSAGDRF